MSAKLVPVRFLKNNLPYIAGEVAWFSEIEAVSLIKQGFAERAADAGEFVPHEKPGRLNV